MTAQVRSTGAVAATTVAPRGWPAATILTMSRALPQHSQNVEGSGRLANSAHTVRVRQAHETTAARSPVHTPTTPVVDLADIPRPSHSHTAARGSCRRAAW